MLRLPSILVCDDDSLFHQTIDRALRKKYDVRSVYTAEEALAAVKKNSVQLMLLDVNLKEGSEGLGLIPRLREADPDLVIVMCSGRTDFSTVREALRLGAKDYLAKDCEPAELELVLERALKQESLRKAHRRQNFEVATGQSRHSLVGESAAIQGVRRAIEKMRPSYANVVITGETGVGKEVVARQMRKTFADGNLEPFVAIDSATIQSNLAESMLFGHEKGAFPGAEQLARGAFEEAHGGVIYFDEIANMGADIQAKLLRVLQEKEIRRVGGTKSIPLEFRVIAATNQPLERLVAEGKFKEDLLQRLTVLPLNIPPLRERGPDILALFSHFAAATPGATALQLSEPARAALRSYPWPGNVRELANLVSYLAVMAEGAEVDLADLPPKFSDAKSAGSDFYAAVEGFEKDFLQSALASNSGSTAELAAKLGMGRSHLYAKLKKYGISS